MYFTIIHKYLCSVSVLYVNSNKVLDFICYLSFMFYFIAKVIFKQKKNSMCIGTVIIKISLKDTYVLKNVLIKDIMLYLSVSSDRPELKIN